MLKTYKDDVEFKTEQTKKGRIPKGEKLNF